MNIKQVYVRLVFLSLVLAIPANAVIGSPTAKASRTTKSEKSKALVKRSTETKVRSSNKRAAVSKSTNEAGLSKSRDIARSNPKNAEKKSSKLHQTKTQLILSRRQRAIEERRAAAARAERARLVAAAREKARNEELRNDVQDLIAKDDPGGEDPEVRRVAISALGNRAGTVVVMNPQTGRIYSIVNQQWALNEGFKPCSTIKIVTGLAGLNEKVIDPYDTTKISERNQVSLTRALAYSKNEYFQQVGSQVGFNKMLAYARQLGLGEKTGINLRNEFQGRLPRSDERSAIYRMSSHGDNFQVTALQLATLVSAMANGGKLVTPYVVRTRQDEISFKTRIRRRVSLQSETWRHMIPGMVGAVEHGSGQNAYDPNQSIAGKTGTCIEQGSSWVGLFTSFAPLANPRLAVVVITRGADAHSHFPATVAGRIYRDLRTRFGTAGTATLASNTVSHDALNTSAEENDELNTASKVTSTAVAQPLWRNNNLGSKVKSVGMALPKGSERTLTKTNVETRLNSVTKNGQTRPRRVFGE